MELKDVILSTLAEIDAAMTKTESTPQQPKQPSSVEPDQAKKSCGSSDELRFLEDLRERLLVLFEGFQSPNNKNIEAKVDLTLNFLEYLLSTVDTRIEKIKP